MADDVDIKDAADVTKKIAADEVGAKFYQLIKLAVGGDGVAVPFLHKAGPQADTYTAAHGAGLGGPVIDVSAQGMGQAGMEVKATGGTPTSWEVHLQTSFDNVSWDTLEKHLNGVNQLATKVWSAPGIFGFYFRTRVVALVLGPATNVVVTLALKD